MRCSRHGGSERDPEVPKEYEAADLEVVIPKVCEGDCVGLQDGS